MAFNTLPIFLSPVFLLLPNIQCVFSIPVNIGFPRYATKGSAHCCNAVRLVYAFTPQGTFRSELNIGIGRPNQGTTLLSSEDKHHTSDANQLWESHNAEDDSLRASIGRHQGSSVRLLIVDAVSAMMLHKRMGPSVHVNMMVRDTILAGHSDVEINLPRRLHWRKQSLVTFHYQMGQVHLTDRISIQDYGGRRCMTKDKLTVDAIAMVEIDVPDLAAEVKRTAYNRQSLEAIVSMQIAEHLKLSKEDVRKVIFSECTIQIVLSVSAHNPSSGENPLEKTMKILVDWINGGGDLFDISDFKLPPVRAVRELYPASTLRNRYERSAKEDTVPMSVTQREVLSETFENGNTDVLQQSFLAKIKLQHIDVSKYKSGVGKSLIDELHSLLPSFNVYDIRLPGNRTLYDFHLNVNSMKMVDEGLKISAKVPDKYERYFNVASLQFTNSTLTVDIHIDNNSLAYELKATVSAQIRLSSGTVEASIALSSHGQPEAVLYLAVRQLRIFDLLTKVIGHRLSNVLRSNGFMDMIADYVSLHLMYGTSQPVTATFHIEISSMKNFASVMFKNGRLSEISSKVNLDKLFSSFDVNNVNVTVVLKAGELSLSVYGIATMPQLGTNTAIELTVVNAGAGTEAYRLMKLEVPSINLVDAISSLMPNLSSLKSVNGLGNLTVPTFGFSMATGRPPNLSDLKSLEFRYTRLSLLDLIPSRPGTGFIIKLLPRLRKGESTSDVRSRDITLMGNFLRGGFSLSRIAKLKGTESGFSLASFIDMVFSSFNLMSVKLPQSLSSFREASMLEFSINSTSKIGQFTVDLGHIQLLKGILPKLSLAESRQTKLSVAIGYDAEPFTWSMNATCDGTFFGSSSTAYVSRLSSAFEFSFAARNVSVRDLLSRKKGGGIGPFSDLMNKFGVLNLAVQHPKIRIVTKPVTVVMIGSITVGRLLPRLNCEFLGLRMFSNKSNYVFGMESGAVQLSDVVKTFLRFDISQIPFFGSLTIPDLTMTLMPKKIGIENLMIIDTPLSNLVMQGHSSGHALLLTIPIKFKAGLVNTTSSLSNPKIDLWLEALNASLTDVLRTVSPHGLDITKLPTFFGPLQQLYVHRFFFMWTTRELAVHVAYPKSILIAKNTVSLSNIDLELRYKSGSFNFSFSSDALLMNTLTLRANVSKSGYILHSRMHSPTAVSLGELFKNRLHITQTLNAMNVSSLVVHNVFCEVKFSTHLQFYHFLLSGRTQFRRNDLSSMVLVIGSQKGNGSSSAATSTTPLLFVICLQDANVAEIVKSFTGQDVSKVPLIGRLKANQMTVVAATGDVTVPMEYLRGCSRNVQQTEFHRGFSFDLNITTQGERSQMILTYAGSQLYIRVQNLPLLSSIILFFPTFTASMLHFPKGYPPIEKMKVRKLLFDSQAQQAVFDVDLGRFKLPHSILTCNNIILLVTVQYGSKPYNYTYKSACTGKLFSQDVDLAIAVTGQSTHIRTTINDVSLFSLLSRGSLADKGFVKFLSNFNLINITVRNATLVSTTRPSLLSISGDVLFGGARNSQLEYVVKNAMNKATRVMSVGLVLSDINLSKLFQALFKKSGFTSFLSIGNVVLDEVRLLALPKTTLSLHGMKLSDMKLERLLHKAITLQNERLSVDLNSTGTNSSSIIRSILTNTAAQLAGLVTVRFSKSDVDINTGLSSRRFDFNPKNEMVSIMDLIKKFLPQLDSPKLPSFLPNLRNVFVNRFLLDFKEKKFLMRAYFGGRLTIFPKYMTLNETDISIAYQSHAFNFSFTTTASVAGVTLHAVFSKTASTYHLVGKVRSLSVASTLKGLGNLAAILKSFGLNSFQIQHALLDLTWNEKENILTFYGYPSLTDLERASMQLTLFNITKMSKQAFFFNFEIQEGVLASVVKSLTGINIKGFPRLGNATIPNIAVWVASEVVVFDNVIKLHTNVSSFRNYKEAKKGIFVNFERRLSDGSVMPISLGISNVAIHAVLTRGLSLDGALQFFFRRATQSSTYRFFHSHFTIVFHTTINELLYFPDVGRSSIKGRTPVVLNLVKGEVQVKNVEFEVSLQNNQDFGMKINGHIRLFNVLFVADIQYDTSKSKLQVKLQTKGNLKLINLLNAISTKVAKNKFVKVLRLDKFELNQPYAEVIYANNEYALQVRAEASIPLFRGYLTELIMMENPKLYVLILSRKGTTMADMLKSFTGIDMKKLFFFRLFSGPCSIGIVYTNAKEGQELPVKLQMYPLEGTKTLPKGLSLFFQIQLPECGKNKLCVFFKKLFGDQVFKLEIQDLGGSPEIVMEAPIPGRIKIAGIDIYNVRFGVSFGTNVKFGLTHAEMDIAKDRDTRLHFVGDLVTDAVLDIEMKFTMEGMWRKAFSISFLALGNVIVRFRVNSECPVCVTAGEFGGEAWLGYNCQLNENTTKCIMGRGYFSFDAEEPENNYFFFNINQFSYRRVLIAVGIPIDKIPAFSKILEYWLVENVLFSYSIQAREVPHGNTTQPIPSGIVFRGKFTFLWALKANIKARVTMFNGVITGVSATVWTNPVRLGEYVHLTASDDDRKGAIFNLKAGILPLAFVVRLSARLTIPALKIRVNVIGNITTKSIEFHFDSHIFILAVTMDLGAAFREPLNPRTFKGFRAKGEVKPEGLNFAWSKVKQACNTALAKANAYLKRAKASLKKITNTMKGILANKNAATKVKIARETALKKAEKKLKSAVNKVKKLCKTKHCKLCGVPRTCVKEHCTCKVRYPCHWGKWCCKHVCIKYHTACGTKCLPVKPACLAYNSACLTQRMAAIAAKKVASSALKLASKAFSAAQKSYITAAKEFAKHNPAMEAARATVAVAENAVSAIGSVVKRFDFSIDRIAFDVELGATTKGVLAANMDVTTEGKRQRFGLRINVKNFMSTAWELARKFFGTIFDWLKKLNIHV